MKAFEIPIIITVLGHTKAQAEQKIFDYFRQSFLCDEHKDFDIADWDFVSYARKSTSTKP